MVLAPRCLRTGSSSSIGPDGSVAKLNWATYLFTREPIAFGEHLDP